MKKGRPFKNKIIDNEPLILVKQLGRPKPKVKQKLKMPPPTIKELVKHA